jgi:predicted dehydrogenase
MLGGGVLRDLSHELDFLRWMFGPFQKITSLGGKFSSLEIDSDDYFSILAKGKNGINFNINLNYLDRNNTRTISVFTNECTIRAELNTGEIYINGHLEKISVNREVILLEMYKSLLNPDQRDSLCTYSDALSTVEIIEHIESCSEESNWLYCD